MKELIYKVLSEINTEVSTFPSGHILELFSRIDQMLISFLESLSDKEWHTQTIAKQWSIKDVVSHLLDGNLRSLSIGRDKYFHGNVSNITTYADLVNYINELNMTWTNATKRLSPAILIQWLKVSGREYIEYLRSLNPNDEAIFSVAWAGQHKSPNWFHIAREYTEKYLHQLQIRDALGNKELFTKEFFHPFIDIFMTALPYTFKNVEAEDKCTVTMIVTSEIGGQWNIIKEKDGWTLNKSTLLNSDSVVKITPDLAWKLFSKSLRPDEIMDKIEISGNQELAKKSLHMVAVMA